MRYINKEYGSAFFPPYSNFYKESAKGPAIKDANYPGKYIIGAGYDYSAINGAMLVGKNGSLWGVRVNYFAGNKWLDSVDFLNSLSTSCVSAPDESFSHFSSGPLSVKWARHNQQGLGLEISASRRLRVRVIFYPCYEWPGELSIEGSFVKGRSPYVAVMPGEIKLTDSYASFKERYQVVLDDKPSREYFIAQSYNKPLDSANGAFNEVMMEFIINNNQPSVYLYCAMGDEKVLAMDIPRRDKIATLIETAELRYGVNKTTGSGVLGKPIENMINSVMWSRIYFPYLLSTIYTTRRNVLDNHFDIRGLEENSAALMAGFAGEGNSGDGQLGFCAEDKIMTVLAVWTIYSRLKDKTSLIKQYGKLTKLYPPVAALVVSGEDKNEVAYKWEDSPLKEEDRAASMYSLDLSCAKLFAFDILERIAVRFDLSDAGAYGAAKREMRALINNELFDTSTGLYLNRYLSGEWSNVAGATSFYPLLAGAPDEEQLIPLINNLTDKKLFWTEYPVPTLIKTAREYGRRSKPDSNGKVTPKYLMYRGSVIPYVNYIIYQGLIRYGLDEIAGELAYKSAKLWLNHTNAAMDNFAFYLPTGGKVRDPKLRSNLGNMMALIGIQTLIDVDYFRDDMGFAIRFGTFAKGAHAISKIKIMDNEYSISVDDYSTILLANNTEVFRTEGGRCIVRQFTETKDGCEFVVNTLTPVKLDISVPFIPTVMMRKRKSMTVSLPKGRSKVTITGNTPNVKLL